MINFMYPLLFVFFSLNFHTSSFTQLPYGDPGMTRFYVLNVHNLFLFILQFFVSTFVTVVQCSGDQATGHGFTCIKGFSPSYASPHPVNIPCASKQEYPAKSFSFHICQYPEKSFSFHVCQPNVNHRRQSCKQSCWITTIIVEYFGLEVCFKDRNANCQMCLCGKAYTTFATVTYSNISLTRFVSSLYNSTTYTYK